MNSIAHTERIRMVASSVIFELHYATGKSRLFVGLAHLRLIASMSVDNIYDTYV